MIVIRENERLYLSTWEYNMCRIMTTLAEQVVGRGGRVKPQKKAIISNRNVDALKREYSEKIETYIELEKEQSYPPRAAASTKYREKLEELEAVNNEPITVTHTSYISFVLNDMYYYYQMDDNPFFEFMYSKTPIRNGKRSANIYLSEDIKEWAKSYDLFKTLTDMEVSDAATKILEMLLSAPISEVYRETKRTRVPNTYDDGYHYEMILEPERFNTVDF